MLLEPPRTLPVGHLSPSSVSLYLKSPIRWRKRYVENLYEPMSPGLLLGRAAGAAERESFGHQIETGTQLTEREVLDAFSDAWTWELDQVGDQVEWDEPRGRVKDSGYRVLPIYHRLIAPTVRPIAVERAFVIHPVDVEWTIEGYMDVEERAGIRDHKMRSRQRGLVTQEEADQDLQAGTYLLGRRAESNPARVFFFDAMVRAGKKPPRPGDVHATATARSDEQLDAVLDLYYRVAAEIDWRLLYDVWTPPPPGSWWCSREWCGYWSGCEFGGAGRTATPVLPRPRRIPDTEVYAAIAATQLKSTGATTAAKVAVHLGLSVAAAAGRLAALPDVVSERPTRKVDPVTREPSRRKDALTVAAPGPMVYRRDTTARDLERSLA